MPTYVRTFNVVVALVSISINCLYPIKFLPNRSHRARLFRLGQGEDYRTCVGILGFFRVVTIQNCLSLVHAM